MGCKRLVSLGCLLLTLTGCGLTAAQKADVANFGIASTTATTIAADELLAMRNETVNMNTHRIEVRGLEPNWPGLARTDAEFKPEYVLEILKAIDALKAYATSLDLLVKDTQHDELTKAAADLTGSIDGLPDRYVAVSKKDQDAIQEAVVAAGGIVVEAKKKRAVAKIVSTYQEQVNRLADLLANEFDETRSDTLAASFLATSSTSLVLAENSVKQCPDVYCRERAVRNYREAKGNFDRGKLVSANVSKAIAGLKKANAELMASLHADTLGEKDLKDFSVSVKTLVEAVKVLRK